MSSSHSRFQLISIETVRILDDGRPIVRVVFKWDGKRKQRTMPCGKLLGQGDSNVKLSKNSGKALSYGLSLSPARMIGTHNTCAAASPACRAACLNETGNGFQFSTTQLGRIVKTYCLFNHKQWFLSQLHRELSAVERKAKREEMQACVRLNMFQDLPWERIDETIITAHSSIQFYDYTKIRSRAGELFPNYWVTFSRSEVNESAAIDQLNNGRNVAVVFHDGLPARWHGFAVIDGDKTDLRFTDPRGLSRGYVIGLKLKAPTLAKREQAKSTGFAITSQPNDVRA